MKTLKTQIAWVIGNALCVGYTLAVLFRSGFTGSWMPLMALTCFVVLLIKTSVRLAGMVMGMAAPGRFFVENIVQPLSDRPDTHITITPVRVNDDRYHLMIVQLSDIG